MVAAVATGAFAAAGQTITIPPTSHEDVSDVAFKRLMASAAIQDRSGVVTTAALGMGGAAPLPEVLPPAPVSDIEEVGDLAKGAEIAERAARDAADLAAREAAAVAAAARPGVVPPTNGIITSSYGPRWGTTHYGLDIANDIGTPILAVMDGVVLDAGPVSGFGLWVRLLHDDGTITVYGHIDRTLVEEGQRVRAGDPIADMGNRGQSTGPHLHFEVHSPDGEKLSPQAWLEERGAMDGIDG